MVFVQIQSVVPGRCKHCDASFLCLDEQKLYFMHVLHPKEGYVDDRTTKSPSILLGALAACLVRTVFLYHIPKSLMNRSESKVSWKTIWLDMMTYIVYKTQLTTSSHNFEADEITKWRNPIRFSTNDAGNMCSMTKKIIVDLIRIS